MLNVAVLGAPGSGKTWLAGQLRQALATRAVSVSDGAALLTAVAAAATPHVPLPSPDELAALAQAHGRQYGLSLLMGLDLAPAPQARAGQAVDEALRAALDGAGLAYKVIYGRGEQRLQNALLAVEAAGVAAPEARLATQYGLQGGRVTWRCENCSDPDCEHKLFTGLLR